MEAFLAQERNIKVVLPQQSLNAAAAETERVSLVDRDRVAFLIIAGAGATTDFKVELKQYLAASGGVAAELAVDNPAFVKAGAATVFTKIEVADGTFTDEYSLTGLEAGAGIAVVEVLAEDLNRNANYTHVSLNIPVLGAARNVTVIALTGKEKFLPAYKNVI